jgi:hypothetical protein
MNRAESAAAQPRNLLKWGGANRKLGQSIWSFSIPAIKTCPGATAFCKLACYVLKGRTATKGVQKAYEAARLFSTTPAFVGAVIAFVRLVGPPIVRIHVSGDFYSAEYVRKWAEIARKCPGTVFYAYTRSWRDKAILPELRKFSRIPNVQLFWSEDRETGRSPKTKGVQRAFMVKDRSDDALVDVKYHDLVFRDRHHRSLEFGAAPVKNINGVQVCPAEQWYVFQASMAEKRKEPPKFTCSSCRLCFRDAQVKAA